MRSLFKDATISDGRAGDDEDSEQMTSSQNPLPVKKSVHFRHQRDVIVSEEEASNDVIKANGSAEKDGILTSYRGSNGVTRLKYEIPGVCEIISHSRDDDVMSLSSAGEEGEGTDFGSSTTSALENGLPPNLLLDGCVNNSAGGILLKKYSKKVNGKLENVPNFLPMQTVVKNAVGDRRNGGPNSRSHIQAHVTSVTSPTGARVRTYHYATRARVPAPRNVTPRRPTVLPNLIHHPRVPNAPLFRGHPPMFMHPRFRGPIRHPTEVRFHTKKRAPVLRLLSPENPDSDGSDGSYI